MDERRYHTVEFPNLNVTKFVPKELEYCSTTEYRDIVRLLFLWQTDSISYPDFRVQAIYSLLNLKKGKRNVNDIEIENMYANLSEVSTIMDSFFIINPKEKTNTYKVKLAYNKNMVPFIKPFLKKWYGPKPMFVGTTWGQYEEAVNKYHRFLETKDTKYVIELMAIYYQTPETFDKNKIEKRASLIKRLVDFAQVYGFFLCFSAFQERITSAKIKWEGKTIDLSILFTSDNNVPESKIPGLGTKSLGFQLAESGVFGTLQELRKQDVWEVFLRLYDITKRDLDEQARQKAAEKANN